MSQRLLTKLPSPPGYNEQAISSFNRTGPSERELIKLKENHSMVIAKQPFQGLFMQGFMMYMSGSTVQIMSMMVVSNNLMNACKSISNVGKIFKPVEHPQVSLSLPKLIFIGIQCLAICLVLWKLSAMGLLPTTSGDWMMYLLVKKVPLERSGGGMH